MKRTCCGTFLAEFVDRSLHCTKEFLLNVLRTHQFISRNNLVALLSPKDSWHFDNLIDTLPRCQQLEPRWPDEVGLELLKTRLHQPYN